MKNSHEIYDQLPLRFNLAAYLLENISDERASRVAFYSENNIVTYRQLVSAVKMFAELLASCHFVQEDRLVILLPDSLEFVYGFLGTIWLGGVTVLVNEAYSEDDILYILEDCRAKVVLTNKKWSEKLKDKANPSSRWLIVDDEEFIQDFSKLPGLKKSTSVAREEPAFWVYTSGSTGRPKGVIHAHFNPIVAAENYGKHILNINTTDIVYSAAPMAFSYGLGATIYLPLYFKASAIISPKKTSFAYIETINQFKPTIFFGIPHTYAGIHALREISPLDPSSLRLCISAAEQLPISLWNKWKESYGIALCEGIGTTESTHIFISNNSNSCTPGSSGKSVPGYCVRLIDENGKEVQVGEVGFLEVSGEGFLLSYWNKLKETQKLIAGQTMLTGDFYRRDENDNFYYIGRNDKLIKIKGMWILPMEIENVFLQHDSVLEAAVTVGKGLLEDTADIIAYIQLKDNHQDSAEQLKEINLHLKNMLPRFKIPRKIHLVQALPRTATGKVHKKQLENIHHATV
jgi:benzoate-CoA ligase family protein